MPRVKEEKDIFPFLNQVWNFYITSPREGSRVRIVVGEINEDGTVSYDTQAYICSLRKSPNQIQMAKLIAFAPSMFRTLLNIAGEVKYGTTSLPDPIMESIERITDNIISIKDKDETE